NILIDGGPDNSVLAELGKNLAFFDKNIDLMILTHAHADHVVGLIEVMRRYKVKKILFTGAAYYAPYYLAFLEEINRLNIATEITNGQQDIIFGDNLTLKILYPFNNINGQIADDANDQSIIAKLVYLDNTFLLTGDAEAHIIEELINNNIDISADVLKVPHHGSCAGLNEKIIKIINPEIAVISVGTDNKYGHPCADTINLLNNNNISILRTDTSGTLKFISDGQVVKQK
ncbi:MBL fold metallo-hydrolase, partial [Candidatus Falkowbacteria bacterium]|nr:MBL fold metallo-hydrolase [Candidatus Falkowbacteria bacterium]